MVTGANDRIEIARRPAMRTGIAFSRDTNPLSIAGSGLNPDLQRFGALDRPVAVAHRTCSDIFSRPMAARARDVELPAAAGLRDLPLAAALRTGSRGFDESLAVAVGAGIAAGDVQ